MPLPSLLRLEGLAHEAEAAIDDLVRSAAERIRRGERVDLSAAVREILAPSAPTRWPAFEEWLARFRDAGRFPVLFRECIERGALTTHAETNADRADVWPWPPGLLDLYAHTLGEESAKVLDVDKRREIVAGAKKLFIVGGDFDDCCPVCTDLRGRKFTPLDTPSDRFPPYHPGCRCRTGIWVPRMW